MSKIYTLNLYSISKKYGRKEIERKDTNRTFYRDQEKDIQFTVLQQRQPHSAVSKTLKFLLNCVGALPSYQD